MTLLSPPFALGAAGQVLSGKMLRLAEGAAFRNAATGVQGVSGILYGPAGTMGELTLNSNSSLTINPFRAVVQQTQDVTQGQYLVANDAAVTATNAVVAGAPTMPAQDASQFRRAYVATYVADSQVSGVASSATTDRAVLDILPGALAATAGAAAYPAIPPNALLLGELLIPPTGQSVTLTPYNPRTTTRGGILPVIADGASRAGHDGDPGTHLGQYRDHPTLGPQRWNGTVWKKMPGVAPTLIAVALSAGQATQLVPGQSGFSVTGNLAIPAHAPGTLHIVWHVMHWPGAGGAVIAGYDQVGIGLGTTGQSVVGERVRYHNNSVNVWTVNVQAYYDSDGQARYTSVIGWNDAGSNGTSGVDVATCHVWLL